MMIGAEFHRAHRQPSYKPPSLTPAPMNSSKFPNATKPLDKRRRGLQIQMPTGVHLRALPAAAQKQYTLSEDIDFPEKIDFHDTFGPVIGF
jgi:hypothetical protein